MVACRSGGDVPTGGAFRGLEQSGARARTCCRLAALTGVIWIAQASGLVAARPAQDIPYFLAVDLPELEVSVTTTTVGTVEKEMLAGPEGPVAWKFSRSVTVERVGGVALKTVADSAAQRQLRVPKTTWSDVDATVELTDAGLLAGINASAEGRGGDFLLAVARFAGVVAGFAPVAGAGAFVLDDVVSIQQVSGSAHAIEALVTSPAIECPDAQDLPVELEAFVRLDPAGCPAFTMLRDATANVEGKRIKRDLLAEQVPGSSGAELTEINRKLQSYRQEVAYAEAVEAQRRATLTTLFDRFAKARCLGQTVKSTAFRELLALDRLPPAGAMRSLGEGVKVSREAVQHSLQAGNWREMLDVFKRTGVVATLDGAPAPPELSSTEVKLDDPVSAIAWRQAVPVRLRIWTLVGDADPTTVIGNDARACKPTSGEDPDKGAVAEVSFDGVIDVLHPNSPVRTLPLEARVFSDRSLAIEFDPRGRPRRFDTSGSSSVAGFAQAAAASAQGFRDEYDSTLKKRVSIEESRRELALDGLNDKIADLEAQKEELDARAELLGASGSFDDLVARQKLDSELKLLEAQVALRTAEATAEHRVAIAELEKRVLETQKRLSLLEAEQALEEARRRR